MVKMRTKCKMAMHTDDNTCIRQQTGMWKREKTY